MNDLAGPIVLCGAGKMGGALLEGWLQAGLAPGKIAVIEPHPAPPIAALAARGVRLNPDPATLKNAAAIVIAVKPQIAAEALPAVAPMIGPATVVVSIMADAPCNSSPARSNMPARWCAPCRTPRPRSAAGLRSRCRCTSVKRSAISRTVC